MWLVNGAATDASASEREMPTSAAFQCSAVVGAVATEAGMQ